MRTVACFLLLAAQERPQEFDRAFALVKASPGEARWDEIRWTTSLWEARQKAASEGKPLLLWAANGNPLGIT